MNKKTLKSYGLQAELKYFDQNCELSLRINTSCGKDELSNDVGEGKGGLWSNHFLARGKNPKFHHG